MLHPRVACGAAEALAARNTYDIGAMSIGQPGDKPPRGERADHARPLTVSGVHPDCPSRLLVEVELLCGQASVDDGVGHIAHDRPVWRLCQLRAGEAQRGVAHLDAGTFVVKMVGSYTNIVGLPLYESMTLLGGEGFPIRFGWLNAS